MAVTWGSRQQKALIRRLLKALRSKDYFQISGCLEAVDGDGVIIGNCVMGVAFRVLEQYIEDNKIKMEFDLDLIENINIPVVAPYVTSVDGHSKVIPSSVKDAYGFTTQEGHFDKSISGLYTTLIDMNDAGMSFRKIARVIERRPEGLFTNS